MEEKKFPYKDESEQIFFAVHRFLGLLILRLLGSFLLTYPVTGILVTTWFFMYGVMTSPHDLEWSNVGYYIGFFVFMALVVPISGKLEVGGKPDYFIYLIEAAVFITMFLLLSGGWGWPKEALRKKTGE
jgi:hypothetical protein